MSQIITLEQEMEKKIMGEINAVLHKYRKALNPSVHMTTGGIAFKIDLVDVNRKPAIAGPSGSGGESHGGQ